MFWFKNPRNGLFCLFDTFCKANSIASQRLPVANPCCSKVSLCPAPIARHDHLCWRTTGKTDLQQSNIMCHVTNTCMEATSFTQFIWLTYKLTNSLPTGCPTPPKKVSHLPNYHRQICEWGYIFSIKFEGKIHTRSCY